VESRASKHYNSFVDTFVFYQTLFNGSGDLNSILNLPYPLYRDIILAQVQEKRKENSISKRAFQKQAIPVKKSSNKKVKK